MHPTTFVDISILDHIAVRGQFLIRVPSQLLRYPSRPFGEYVSIPISCSRNLIRN